MKKQFNFEVVMTLFGKFFLKVRHNAQILTTSLGFFGEVSVSKFRSRLHLWQLDEVRYLNIFV